jgi:hypothetical protein
MEPPRQDDVATFKLQYYLETDSWELLEEVSFWGVAKTSI